MVRPETSVVIGNKNLTFSLKIAKLWFCVKWTQHKLVYKSFNSVYGNGNDSPPPATTNQFCIVCFTQNISATLVLEILSDNTCDRASLLCQIWIDINLLMPDYKLVSTLEGWRRGLQPLAQFWAILRNSATPSSEKLKVIQGLP